jgi:predicted AlkP superfamily phosphohydrolase/phosphomutase
MDGLDPELLIEFVNKGELPNFKKLMEMGSFKKLKTSHPPQSPVAWSNFITGNNPGKHGIYDFIHRDPKSYNIYLSTSKIINSRWNIKIGNWKIPIIRSKIELTRKGKPFWAYLEDSGIPAFIIKIPSSFPPDAKKARVLSGLGTPDIKGTNGEFSIYTDKLDTDFESVEGGNIYRVTIIDNSISTYIYGPINTLKKGHEQLKVKLKIFLSEDKNAILIKAGRKEISLKVGEWSNWIPLNFKVLGPLYSISAICRFYLKETSPHFKLYISPLNIDPSRPNIAISAPKNFSREIYKEIGYFYTQGLPLDSKVLTSGIFDRSDYLKQEALVWEERIKLFEYALNRFDDGVLFFYFTTTDMNQHLFYSAMDEKHPAYSDELNERFGDVIMKTYRRMDWILSKILGELDTNTLLIVFSDHGFAPFYKSFDINAWLYEKGYLKVIDERKIEKEDMLGNINWTETKAYGLGFNSIYLNIKGREKNGIVDEKDRLILSKKIAKELEEIIDPENNIHPIHRAYPGDKIYKGAYKNASPDICIGYNRGYRVSWQSAIGMVREDIISVNKDIWSGTHLISPELVPGILLTNRKIAIEEPDLRDLPVTILKEFNIICNMEGRNLFK